MEVLVCIKRVPLSGGRFVLSDDAAEIDTRRLGFTVSPHEECAVELAVRLVEQHGGASTVLSLGPAESEEQMREAMALGVDRGILLETDGAEWDAGATAAAIADAIQADGTAYDLVLFGNESADAAGSQVGIRVAHLLGRPALTGLKGVSVEGGRLRGERPVSGGREVFDVPLPAVATVKDGVTIPRYPSVPGRIRAKKKPIERSTPVRPAPRLEKLTFTLPAETGKRAQVLGSGPDAAAAVVEVFRTIGAIQ
jgi:electron transfer flavoprotein beta subunit